jgi:hypothetical protein
MAKKKASGLEGEVSPEVHAAMPKTGTEASATTHAKAAPKSSTKAAKKKSKKKAGATTTNVVKPKRSFPTLTLKEALPVAEAFRTVAAGDEVDTSKIAEHVGYSKKNNKFFYIAAASRDYSLSSGGRDTAIMTLLDLGKQIVNARNPNAEHQAKIKAFLSVEPFGNLFKHHKRLADLPEGKYLTNFLEQDLKIPESLHVDFLRILRENCNYLGITETVAIDAAALPLAAEDGKTAAGRALIVAQTPLAFVIMPFTEKKPERKPGFFKELLSELIEPACIDAGFRVETAVQKGSDVIQSTIINKLLVADLVVCDLTDHNPNVLFELGIRIAKKLPVALIKSSDTGPIFDVDNMMRVEVYDPNLWISSIKEDKPKLTDHIKGAWDYRESVSYLDILQRPQPVQPETA